MKAKEPTTVSPLRFALCVLRFELGPKPVVFTALALVLSGCSLGGGPTPAPLPTVAGREETVTQQSRASAPTRTPYVYAIRDDVQFIDMMVEHHQLAIDMARVAIDHAEHGEIKGLSQDIIIGQQDEINRMLLWRKELVGTSATSEHATPGTPEAMDMHNMPGMGVDLVELADSEQFDRDWIEAMLAHHQAAIDMSQAAIPNLKKSEVRDVANDIINFQQLEIDLMNSWKRDWYE